MKTEDIIASVLNDTFADKTIIPEDINSYQIINISDMNILKELAENRDKFLILTKTDTWQKNDSRQYVLGSTDKLNSFLKEIYEGGCRCTKYRYVSADPEIEESSGLIEILDKKEYRPYFEILYKCRCTLCHTLFDCHAYEVRFGRGHSWSRSKTL